MSLQKWTIRFPSLLSFASFLHSSSPLPHSFIRLSSSYHKIQVFFTLMAIVNGRVVVVGGWGMLGWPRLKTAGGCWCRLQNVSLFCRRDDSLLLRLCESAEFSGYKQTFPGCLEGKQRRERWRRLKWRGWGKENMKMSKRLENKMNEEEEDNDKRRWWRMEKGMSSYLHRILGCRQRWPLDLTSSLKQDRQQETDREGETGDKVLY